MRREKKAKAIIITIAAIMLMMPVAVMAGNLEPSGPPDNGTMHTLDEIYDAVLEGCPNCDGAPVAKTGQTTSYGTGDDGGHEAGVVSPSPRFTDNTDGTVRDNLTGLIWLKNANCFGPRNWATALTDCNTLNSGECGLTDESAEGDWRLSNIKELQSLIDFGNYNPALPTGHLFSGVQSDYYWSGTSYAINPTFAWYVSMYNGSAYYDNKSLSYYVWPVRGGND
jgi:hypothetical protein